MFPGPDDDFEELRLYHGHTTCCDNPAFESLAKGERYLHHGSLGYDFWSKAEYSTSVCCWSCGALTTAFDVLNFVDIHNFSYPPGCRKCKAVFDGSELI